MREITAPRPSLPLVAALFTLIALCTLMPGLAAQEEEPRPEVTDVAPHAATPEIDEEPPPGWPEAAWAGELGAPTRLEAVGSGSLLLATTVAGLYLPAPTVETEVAYQVTGFLARARVTQHFYNPTEYWVEGVYVFPLPENAAVDTLEMRVGERVIVGEIQGREEARQTFEQAKQEGRKASLVEQERPNLFTNSVANLGPGEEVAVTIEFQQELRYDQGTFELRFPMVVGPRYIPGTPIVPSPGDGSSPPPTAAGLAPARAGTGWMTDTDAVPDASRITPPVLHPSTEPANPVRLSVELDAGFALARLESPSHPLAITALGGGRQRIALATGPGGTGAVPADRDFILLWEPDVGQAPAAALFTQELHGETYALLMVLPPLPEDPSLLDLSREVVFVLDTSGSMAGASIREAKSALLLALETLSPQDRFNVIEFNSYTRKLFPASVEAEDRNLDMAAKWVQGLDADGGTEMLPALRAALEIPFATHGLGADVRQVIFITDAGVGNEDELFAYIHESLAESRLFTVGIGTAPNSHFLTRAAELGRGTYTFIASPEEVEERMVGLFAKLESPVLSDLEVVWEDPLVEVWPERVPDLYLGEPVMVAARLSGGAGRGDSVHLTGQTAAKGWQRSFSLARGTERGGIDRLWARRKIASLMTDLATGRDVETVKRAVVEVALAHHLVSQFTSLVAVDVTPTAPEGTVAAVRPIPVNLPAGWEWDAVFGGPAGSGVLPSGATGARQDLLIAALLGLAAWLLRRMGRGAGTDSKLPGKEVR